MRYDNGNTLPFSKDAFTHLDLTEYPGAILDLWNKLPETTYAFERELTEKEERKGIRATFPRWKWMPDWPDIPGVGLNAKNLVRYITVDCDHGDTDRWELIGLVPVMIVYNPGNRRHHVTYELAAPVSVGPRSRRKPMVLMSLVIRALVRDLDGDPCYNMTTTKNPLCPRFRFLLPGGRPYTLQEMAAALDIDGVIDDEAERARQDTGKRTGLALALQDENSRNVRLFNTVRFMAYDEVRLNWGLYHAGGDGPWYGLEATIRGWLAERNIGGLLDCELDAIAKSITKFCRTKLRPRVHKDGKKRGSMRLDADLPLKERQAAGARHTSKAVKERNRATITAAFFDLIKAGVTPTQRMVADATKLSLRTVKAVWKELREDHG